MYLCSCDSTLTQVKWLIKLVAQGSLELFDEPNGYYSWFIGDVPQMWQKRRKTAEMLHLCYLSLHCISEQP